MSLQDRYTNETRPPTQCAVKKLQTTHPEVYAELAEILTAPTPPVGAAVARALKAEYDISVTPEAVLRVMRELRDEA